MLKNATEVSPRAVSEEAILAAMKRFLQRLAGENILVAVDNPASSEFGASDLAFVLEGRDQLVTVLLHRQGEFEGFVLRTAAYHRWLKECIRFSEKILNRKIGLEMHLISCRTPSRDDNLLRAIDGISELSFIEYQVLMIEDQESPVIRFSTWKVEPFEKVCFDFGKDNIKKNVVKTKNAPPSPIEELSPLEVAEFDRLKARYL